MAAYTGLFLLSAATLAFEVNLTRIFSVAQFYHFAFMIVSLALLGTVASGSFLILFPRLCERDPAPTLTWLSWGFAFTAIGSYTLTLYMPFDSFRIAHNWRQGAVLALHYVALAMPFFCGGAATASRRKSAAALPEVVQHEVNGLLVPAGDVPAWTAALRRFASDPMLRARLRAGIPPIRTFAEYVDEVEDVLKQAAG